MKENYIVASFRQTAAERFPEQAQELNAALDKRLAEMRKAHENDTKEKKEHLEGQIFPGIAAYETLQTVMSKEEARKTVHDYVEQRAWKLRAIILKLMRVPGLYRLVPGVFTNGTRNGGVRGEGVSDERRRLADRYGEMPVSRHLCAIRLSGALLLFLRQRRYHL